MTNLYDGEGRYGSVSRFLHWGMAVLFAAQFVAAAAHWALPRDSAFREAVWAYHPDLGITLFLLVLIRGVWGVANLPQRPDHVGIAGRLAVAGHIAIYLLMILVPFVRLLSAAGSTRGLSYLGLEIFPARAVESAWTQGPAQWHGEMGWLLAVLIIGHAGIALFWHGLWHRDGTLNRMLD